MVVLMERACDYLNISNDYVMTEDMDAYLTQLGVADYAKESVVACMNLGIIDGNFNPKQVITREKMAQVFEKLVNQMY